jgi:hypothetical protein
MNALRVITVAGGMALAACARLAEASRRAASALQRRPELRPRIARGFRDALTPTLDARELRFEAP